MLQLIICKGLPASGKTTWAKAWVNEDSKHRVRVNRDDIRRMLGPYWLPEREFLVTIIEKETTRTALREGYSVVVDATNFKAGWIQEMAKNLQMYMIFELVNKDFTDVSLETCIERDKLRTEAVGEEVIRKMYNKYLKDALVHK